MLGVTSIIRRCYHCVSTISLTSHTSKCDLWSKNDSAFLVKVWLLIVSLIFRTAVTLRKHAKYQAGANTNKQTRFTSSGELAHVDWSTVAECSIFRVKHCKKAIGSAEVHHVTGGMAITLHVWIPCTYQNQIQIVLWLAIPNPCLWWLIAYHHPKRESILPKYRDTGHKRWLQSHILHCSVPVEGGKIPASPPAEIKITISCQLSQFLLSVELSELDPGELYVHSHEKV
jgi:hypothetical protein